ncbi:hypothetical protein B296_00046559 [Ensete ventricosum]|uniref:Uncharacterized protein n=1 Tax=Ensete ventricosum TaxID=4639 RepID=A0A426YJ47_ENSVE|nr:hypothetical protein B296_00046559 [Ensete ventricosum]
MISLLPLQEFMSLTSVQGKLCASVLCSLFYVDSLHVALILYQVPPKFLYLPICIELMVALMPTIPRVNPLSLILISTLSVPSYDVVIVAPPLNLAIHPPMHYLIRDHAITPRRLLNPLSFVEILS